MSAVQRRAEAIAAIYKLIVECADDHAVLVDGPFVQSLAERLFELRPAYCPYDSGCHDEDCPCGNCDSNRREGAESEQAEYSPPCGDPACHLYHCGRCDEHAGMTGHYGTYCQLTQDSAPPHHCCPSNCALAHAKEAVGE